LKLACATCIQGHRASTCKHQDGSKGPLVVVKRRGRPPSQCAECREKRIRTGRHARCDCNAKAKARANYENSSNIYTELPAKRRNIHPSTEDIQGPKRESPLSFDFILNPCKCKEGSICTCCRSHFDHLYNRTSTNGHQAHFPYTPSSKRTHSINDTRQCNDKAPVKSSSCCTTGSDIDRGASERSMDMLIRAADMSKSFSLECQCGANCLCKGCLAVPSGDNTKEKSGPTCGSCVACDIQLQNPTGIESVDRWAQVTDIKPKSNKTVLL